MKATPKVYVAGHRGMVGSAIVRQLLAQGLPAHSIITRVQAELDLTDQAAVRALFAAEKPDQVYLAAAKVGGIHANNTYPAEFVYQNLMIQANVIDAAFRVGVQKLLFLGSSCIYPKLAPLPMAEEALLTGPLEPTNEPYAIAKIAGIKLCESYNRQYGASHGVDYRSVMPTNLYGPGDNYHPENSHVIPDHLDTEQIRFGLSNLRNPALASHAFHLLPHRGLGSGILRATAAWPDIDLIDNRRGNQFKVVVQRASQPTGGVSEGVSRLLLLIQQQPGLRAPCWPQHSTPRSRTSNAGCNYSKISSESSSEAPPRPVATIQKHPIQTPRNKSKHMNAHIDSFATGFRATPRSGTSNRHDTSMARPWGLYDSIEMGDRFQVKRIGVRPGASPSLQKHHHRAEHWIVVQGTWKVTNGDEVFLLSENQGPYIPVRNKTPALYNLYLCLKAL